MLRPLVWNDIQPQAPSSSVDDTSRPTSAGEPFWIGEEHRIRLEEICVASTTPRSAKPQSQPNQEENPSNVVADEEKEPEKQAPEVDPDRPISISSTSLKPCYKGCRNKKGNQQKEDECTSRKIRDFIRKNLKYPAAAQEEGIEGTIMVRFIIERDGRITGVQYNDNIGGGCGKEAARLVQKMPRFEPGLNQKGEEARVTYNLPIKFKLLDWLFSTFSSK